MATITTRSGKGSPLTNNEVDANFTNLNDDKLETSGGTLTGNLNFGDNDKAIFGAGNDLQIYHDGNNSRVEDTGTGGLRLIGSNFVSLQSSSGENKVVANSNGSVQLYYDNAEKLATTSTGIDVTGSISADGLAIAASSPNLSVQGNSATDASLTLTSAGITSWALRNESTDSSLYFTQDGTNRAKLSSGGDISFYEDTGTTPKLFWDASAESLGIGTSSPSAAAHIKKTDGFQLKLDGGNNSWSVGSGFAGYYDGSFLIANSAGTKFLIDSSGNVGIGTTSPTATLHVDASAPEFRLSQSGTAKVRLRTGGDNYINTGQNLGIGTNSPSRKLTIQGGAGDTLPVRVIGGSGTTTGGIEFQDAATTADYKVQIGSIGDNLYLRAGGAEAMRIDSSGNVGIGTASPNHNLSVNSSSTGIISVGDFTGDNVKTYIEADQTNNVAKINSRNNHPLAFSVHNTERLRIDSSGRVGIGTSSPSVRVDSHDNGVGLRATRFSNPDQYIEMRGGDGVGLSHINAAYQMAFKTGNTERMRIDSSGNVGIGTSSPDGILDIEGDFETQKAIVLTNTKGTGKVSYIRSHGGNGETLSLYHDGVKRQTWDSNGTATFESGGAERMRIDSSGNLLVGKSGVNFNADGTEIKAGGELYVTQTNAHPLQLNRLSSDGAIAQFYKDGSTVGTIGTTGGDVYVGTGDTNVRFDDGADQIYPVNSDGSHRDGAVGLGWSGGRFKDLYLSGGVYLGGTGAANKLDDYEEGTWTPTATLGTFGAAAGLYVKVGDLVTVFFAINTATESTSTNEIKIKSLPFNSAGTSVSFHHGQGSVSYLDQLTGLDITGCLIRSDEINLVRDNTTSLVRYSDASGSWSVRGTVTYKVA